MSKTTKQAKSIDLLRQQWKEAEAEWKRFMRGKQWSKKDLAKLPKDAKPLVLNKMVTMDHYREAIRAPELTPQAKRLVMALQRKINLHASLLAEAESRLRALTMPPDPSCASTPGPKTRTRTRAARSAK